MSDVIYGRNAVLEALRGGRRVEKILLAAGAHGTAAQVARLARERAVPLETVERRELDRLAAGANHQGVVALVAAVLASRRGEEARAAALARRLRG